MSNGIHHNIYSYYEVSEITKILIKKIKNFILSETNQSRKDFIEPYEDDSHSNLIMLVTQLRAE